ncbi:NF-kappa-B-activating protein-like [Oncorhynchus clarkii lewisi]|uniref:NF-kappa-B-activating protein-like n=1 Tax=Oncorhynchus clarkii lewisi TaxID=490388 RepID=UPI0039B9C3AF
MTKGFVRKKKTRERYSNQRCGGRNDDQRQRQNAFISGSKKFKKKKTMKNRKQSASDSRSDGSEEEDTNGDLWVERTCIDKHMVGPEAPFTHLSQDDKASRVRVPLWQNM